MANVILKMFGANFFAVFAGFSAGGFHVFSGFYINIIHVYVYIYTVFWVFPLDSVTFGGFYLGFRRYGA